MFWRERIERKSNACLCLVTKMPDRNNLREERFIMVPGSQVISACSGEGIAVGQEAVDVYLKATRKQRPQMEPGYTFTSTYCQTLSPKAMMAFKKVL